MNRSLPSSRWIVAGCSVLMWCSSLAVAGVQRGQEPADVLDRQSALVARGGPAAWAHQPEELNQEGYAVALIDYADGLARLGRPEAADYFAQAIQATPVPLAEAVNRYAQYLLDRGDARAALTLLDGMTPLERVMNVGPRYLRRQALLQLGLDTRSADEEIAGFQSRAQGAVGGVPAPPPQSVPRPPR